MDCFLRSMLFKSSRNGESDDEKAKKNRSIQLSEYLGNDVRSYFSLLAWFVTEKTYRACHDREHDGVELDKVLFEPSMPLEGYCKMAFFNPAPHQVVCDLLNSFKHSGMLFQIVHRCLACFSMHGL